MKKKNYVSPKMEVVNIRAQQPLLVGSGEQLKSYKSGGDIWTDPEYDE